MRNDTRIDEDEIPVRANLKAARINDPDYGMTQDEIDDRNEFIRCYILKNVEALLLIPRQSYETDFFIKDFEESAFNTEDFHRLHPALEFYKYAFRMGKIMEQVQHLAILYSVLGSEQGRVNTVARYQSLVNREFRNRLIEIQDKLKKTSNPLTWTTLMEKSAELKKRILDCEKVWKQYASTLRDRFESF